MKFSSGVRWSQSEVGRPAAPLAVCFVVCVYLVSTCDGLAQEPRTVGEFSQEVAVHVERQLGLPSPNVLAVRVAHDNTVTVQTENGWSHWNGSKWEPMPAPPEAPALDLPDGANCRQWATGPQGEWAAATDVGLYQRSPDEKWHKLIVHDQQGRIWAATDVRGVTFDAKGQLWFATLAGVGRRDAQGWQFFTGQDGLPYNDFTCCAAAPDGSVWFGTHRGAICFRQGHWAYRQGRRWLPDDDIREIVLDAAGTAWLATANGVGCIQQESMTLARKAEFYEQEIEQSIKRTPYGYVSEAYLSDAGNKSNVVRHDSDNDGLWTSMYGASQCFAHAVDGDAASLKRARQAFEALSFLQAVTQGGQHSPPRGYVARTILPTTGPDPNQGRLAADRRQQSEGDRLWKVYQPRWPKSADEKWYWKSDTSSDELDGHYFFYALYFDLCAQDDQERERVRQVVRELTDHLIDHGFALIDIDGKPTRWGNYRPESLNHDVNWWTERGLNSLSMLSYLAVAHHVTGDRRYHDVALSLMQQHSYRMNALVPKVQRGIGSGNQSDDEMAFMSFYNLIKYTPEVELRRQFIAAFFLYWSLEQPERNPFFHFSYAAHGFDQSFADPFQTHDLSPWGDWLDDSIDMLKRLPLDRLDWGHANSHRIDVVRLPVQQGPGTFEMNQGDRGHRVDGKVLPVDERFFAHWNTDPWQLDYGGSGHVLASGTVFLLPYHMGRYHEFIR